MRSTPRPTPPERLGHSWGTPTCRLRLASLVFVVDLIAISVLRELGILLQGAYQTEEAYVDLVRQAAVLDRDPVQGALAPLDRVATQIDGHVVCRDRDSAASGDTSQVGGRFNVLLVEHGYRFFDL